MNNNSVGANSIRLTVPRGYGDTHTGGIHIHKDVVTQDDNNDSYLVRRARFVPRKLLNFFFQDESYKQAQHPSHAV
jgi:hypothetical protein